MSDGTDNLPAATRDIPVTAVQRWRAFAVCASVAALTLLDLSKVNVALPVIEEALGAEPTQLQLIVSGYVLTFGLLLVPMGRLGDQRSRRVLFVVGLALFSAASLACALSTTATMLLIARLIQGVAAGIQMPQVLGSIQTLFRGSERGRAFGLFGAVVSVSVAIGPTLGGLLIAIAGPQDGWRWIFGINVPLGLAAIALVLWFLPETRERSRRRIDLDPVGVLLFGAAVFSLMWPFLFTTGSPDDDPARWWLLAGVVVFGGLFALWERRYLSRGHRPLLPADVIRIGSFRNGTLVQATYFAALPALLLLTTLYLQTGLDIEPVFAGMVSIGFALTNAIGSWVAGNLVTRYGRAIVVWGLVVVLVSIALIALVEMVASPAVVPYAIAGVLTLAGIGGGMVISPNQTLTLAEVPVAQGGVAGSIGQLGQRIGTAVGAAIALALFYATVFRENGARPKPDTFHDAYLYGMISVAAFVALAFVVATVDLAQRRRAARPAQTP